MDGAGLEQPEIVRTIMPRITIGWEYMCLIIPPDTLGRKVEEDDLF